MCTEKGDIQGPIRPNLYPCTVLVTDEQVDRTSKCVLSHCQSSLLVILLKKNVESPIGQYPQHTTDSIRIPVSIHTLTGLWKKHRPISSNLNIVELIQNCIRRCHTIH